MKNLTKSIYTSLLVAIILSACTEDHSPYYSMTLCPDGVFSVANFETLSGTINGVENFVVQISFSRPAQCNTNLTIKLQPTSATNLRNFTTFPPMRDNTISIAVAPNAPGARFTVFPTDNSDWLVFPKDFTIPFVIAGVGGGLEKGTNLNYFLIIKNNEPIISTPSPLSPVTNSTDGNPPVLKWENVQGADRYMLEVVTDLTYCGAAFCKQVLTDDHIITNSYSMSGYAPGTYYWHVLAIKDGTLSGWSEVWSFTIK